jgi:hypothetical protein
MDPVKKEPENQHAESKKKIESLDDLISITDTIPLVRRGSSLIRMDTTNERT